LPIAHSAEILAVSRQKKTYTFKGTKKPGFTSEEQEPNIAIIDSWHGTSSKRMKGIKQIVLGKYYLIGNALKNAQDSQIPTTILTVLGPL